MCRLSSALFQVDYYLCLCSSEHAQIFMQTQASRKLRGCQVEEGKTHLISLSSFLSFFPFIFFCCLCYEGFIFPRWNFYLSNRRFQVVSFFLQNTPCDRVEHYIFFQQMCPRGDTITTKRQVFHFAFNWTYKYFTSLMYGA